MENTRLIKEYTKATPSENQPQDAIMFYQVLPNK
jgi:hypothetical protein